MTITNTAFRTVTCDTCEKTVTFESTNGLPPDVIEANPWLKTNRAIQRADGKVLSYCSDLCTVKAIEKGDLNSPEPQQVQQATGGAGAIALAAAEARRRQLATQALKDGQPTKVSLVT